jgi:hypothetical protein
MSGKESRALTIEEKKVFVAFYEVMNIPMYKRI